MSLEGRLLISDRAHLLFELHKEIDGAREAELAGTGKQVGHGRCMPRQLVAALGLDGDAWQVHAPSADGASRMALVAAQAQTPPLVAGQRLAQLAAVGLDPTRRMPARPVAMRRLAPPSAALARRTPARRPATACVWATCGGRSSLRVGGSRRLSWGRWVGRSARSSGCRQGVLQVRQPRALPLQCRTVPLPGDLMRVAQACSAACSPPAQLPARRLLAAWLADKLRKLSQDGFKRFDDFEYDVEADIQTYQVRPRWCD